MKRKIRRHQEQLIRAKAKRMRRLEAHMVAQGMGLPLARRRLKLWAKGLLFGLGCGLTAAVAWAVFHVLVWMW